MSLYALHLGASSAVVGLLLALYALLPMVFAVAAGRLSDRIGVRRPMLVGSIGMVAGSALPAVVPGLPALFVSAIVLGVAFMLFQVPAQNATGDMGPPADRSHNFSMLALGYSISGFCGPLIAGFTIDHGGYVAAFAVLALLPLVPVAVLALDRLPLRGPHPARGSAPSGGALELLRLKQLRRVFFANVLLAAAWDLHMIVIPVYGARIGLSASAIGIILASFAAATFVVRFAMRWIVRHATEHQVLTGALVIAGAVYLLFPFSHDARDADGAVVLPGPGARHEPADGDVAAPHAHAARPHGRGRRRADVARAGDGRRGAADVRDARRDGRAHAGVLVGGLVPRGRRSADQARRLVDPWR